MSDYAKCKVAELKKLLKERGQTGAGEKEELVARMRLWEAGEKHKLPDGRNPTALKAAEFRKLLAQRGLPCDLSIESRDALMQRLLEALKQEGGSKRSAGEAGLDEAGGAATNDEDAEALATRLAEQVLELAEGGDPEGVLSLLGQPISRSTPFAQQRKVYLNLARMIHPDKLPRYQQATKAFQALVRAFELLTSPEPPPEASASARAKATAAISRSNERCFKTEVHCPRCKAPWGTADSGVQPFDYNFMMQGLKTYCCALCLCEFGCMTAEHRCPLCKKGFECAAQPCSRPAPASLPPASAPPPPPQAQLSSIPNPNPHPISQPNLQPNPQPNPHPQPSPPTVAPHPHPKPHPLRCRPPEGLPPPRGVWQRALQRHLRLLAVPRARARGGRAAARGQGGAGEI